MPKDINLIKGGHALTLFAADQPQEVFQLPYPATVAGEYGRGYFTLGYALQPAFRPQQAAKLAHAVVGDVLQLLAIPSACALTSLFVAVDHNPPASVHNAKPGGLAATMAGVTFDVVGELRDNRSGALVATHSVPAGLLGLSADAEATHHAFDAFYVPDNQTMLLGLQLLSAPGDSRLGFADMAGRIALVAKVQDHAFPWVV